MDEYLDGVGIKALISERERRGALPELHKTVHIAYGDRDNESPQTYDGEALHENSAPILRRSASGRAHETKLVAPGNPQAECFSTAADRKTCWQLRYRFADVEDVVAHGPAFHYRCASVRQLGRAGLAPAQTPCLGASPVARGTAWGARRTRRARPVLRWMRVGQVYNALFTAEDGKAAAGTSDWNPNPGMQCQCN